MRVLILWADDQSPNLGVRVLGRGTAALARRVWPDAEVEYQNFGLRKPQLPIGKLRSLVKERVTGQQGMQKWFDSFDAIIDTRSGDSFADIYGLGRLMLMSTVAEFATQSGTPLVLGPQTIGPFDTTAGRAIARRSLRTAQVVMARDEASANYSARLGRPVDVSTTDVVFALPVPQVEQTRDVLLNISGLLWRKNPHVDAESYRRTVRELHKSLLAAGRRLSLLAHVVESDNPDSDVAAIREFASTTAPDVEVIIPHDLDDVRDAAASANVVIGSRMHACLNALSVGTPAIPLAYSRKFEPLLSDIGWSHTIDLRSESDVVARTAAAVNDVGLSDRVEEVRARADASLLRAQDALGALKVRQ